MSIDRSVATLTIDGVDQTSPSKMARLISDVLSPPAMIVPMALLPLWYCEAGGWKFSVLYIGMLVLIPIAFVFYLVRSGQVQDIHLPHRRERWLPCLLVAGSSVGALGLFHLCHAPSPFISLASALAVLSTLLLSITLFWKISIHAASTTGMVTLTMLIVGEQTMALALLIPVVGWARVHLRRHSLMQVVAGSLLGALTLILLIDPAHWL